MPYVKSISIRTTVNKSIAYILNPSKTEDLLYASGINCVADKDIAYEQFKNVNDRYSNSNYTNNNSNKKSIKAHHFIHSFKGGTVTPELAHKIANEWAKTVFGDDRQALIATHVDKGHIHSHIIINAYDFNGKKYLGNKSNLQKARDISNNICSQYGIETINGNKHKSVKYKEWIETKKGSSWKNNIRLAIDKAVLKANNIDELISELIENGYKVKRGKYISIKPKDNERYVRSKTLGNDYSEENLIHRINNKDKELPIFTNIPRSNNYTNKAKIPTQKYTGIQLKYVSLIKLVTNLIINGKKPVRKYNNRKPYSTENDYDINILANQIQILNRDNITSDTQLNNSYSEIQKLHNETKESIHELTGLCNNLKGVIDNCELYFELKNNTNLSAVDNLKLTIAKSVIEKYNITTNNELIKLSSEYNESIIKLNELKYSYSSIDVKFKEYKDIIATYNNIINNNYEDLITNKDKQKNNKNKNFDKKL